MTYDWKKDAQDAIDDAETYTEEHREPRWLTRLDARTAAARTFLRAQWPEVLWALFLALLVGIAFRDALVAAVYAGMVLAFQWRLWRAVGELRAKEAELKRAHKVSETLAGAVESSAEYIVQQRMHYEHEDFGPVLWIDGVAYPVDAEHEGRS